MGKNSKGYSTGGGKKALIGVALFVLVAIVVVIILLCIPPNTYKAVQTLNRATETTFLARDAEKNEFNEAELSISGSAFSKYSNEFASIETLTNSVNAVLEFYNSKLIFANVDKNLKRNYKPIKNNLNSAKDSKDKLVNMINDINTEGKTSSDPYRYKLIDFRREYTYWLKCNQSAISALKNAYLGSMGDILENNPATSAVLNAVDNYLSVIISDFEKTNDTDKKTTDVSEYNYKGAGKINNFKKFVDVNLVRKTNIAGYYFSDAIQAKFDVLSTFLGVEKNFVKAVESITESGYFEFTFNDETIKNAVTAFLGGN